MKMRRTILASVVASFAFVGAAAAEAETIPERLMTDLQQDFGFADFHAAGIVGNLARETGNFRYLQEINPLIEGSRGGIGYAQWTGPRRDAYEAWADGRDLTAYETNYGYLVEELNGAYARIVDKVLETETEEEAAETFMIWFLGPHEDYCHLDERVSYAQAYLAGDFSGAGCQSHHEVETSGRMMVVSMCPEPATPAGEDLGVTMAMADIEDLLPEGLDSDIEIVLADMLMRGSPLRSDRVLSFGDQAPVDDPFLHNASLSSDRVEAVTEDTVRSSRDVIYGLLEIE